MAKGKNKKNPKKDKAGKKGERHPFARKEWFKIIAPAATHNKKPVGWTCCKKPQGTQVVADFLQGRVAEITYADINNEPKDLPRRIHCIVDEIQGTNCFTNFYKYELARDKISAMLRKRQTLIEVNSEIKTEDGNIFRIFIVAVSSRQQRQVKLNSYIKHSQVKLLRKRLIKEVQDLAAKAKSDAFIYDVLTNKLQGDLQKLAQKLVPDCKLQIAKIKTIKRSAVDTKKLVEDFKAEGDTKKIDESPDAQNTLSKE